MTAAITLLMLAWARVASCEDQVSNHDQVPAFGEQRGLSVQNSTYSWNDLGLAVQTSTYKANYSLLKKALLNGYDPTAPPWHNQLKVQVVLNELSDINTLEQMITVSTWVRYYWHDPRLAWDKTYYGIDFVTFVGTGDGQEVWGPDAQIFEALESASMMDSQEFSVYPAGDVFVSVPVVYKIGCPMVLADFPFDIQTCKFTLGSWSYARDVLDVGPRIVDNSPLPMDMRHFAQPKDFVVQSVHIERVVTKYACCPHPYPVLTYTVVLQRQPLMYTAGIILPMILVTSMGFVGFLLNPASGERVGLAITVMLTTVAVYFVADQALPPVDKTNVVTNLYIWSLVENVVVMLVSVIVVSLHNVRNSEGLASEAPLLNLFVMVCQQDGNTTGELDQKEIQTALRSAGLSERRMERLYSAIDKKHGSARMTFADWYDVVAEVNVPDGLASTHCVLYRWMLRPFLWIERAQRKRILVRRANASRRLTTQLSEVASTAQVNPIGASSLEDEWADPEIADPENAASVVVDLKMTNDNGPFNVEDIDVDAPLVEKAQEANMAKKVMLITEQEIADPTQIAGRMAAGAIDQFFSIAVPLVYIIICINNLHKYHLWSFPNPKPVPTYVDTSL